MPSRLVKAFLPRSKHLLILWLQSPSAVILEPRKIVCHCFHCFPIYFPCPKRWCCESAALNMPANLENLAVAIGLEMVSFPSIPQKKAMPKNAQTTAQLHSSHTLAKWWSKFSNPGFSSTWTELPDIQVGFRKGRGTRDQIANIPWIIEKAREFQKNIYFCFINCTKAFDCVENSERDGNTRPPDLPLEKSVCRSGNNS